MRIALIDDDSTTNFIHQTRLEKLIPTATIKQFADGTDILEALQKGERFDYAILDLNMPGMNGLSFLSHHKNLPKCHHIDKICLFIEPQVSDTFLEENLLHTILEKPLSVDKIKEIFDL